MNSVANEMIALNKKQVAWLKMMSLPADCFERYKSSGGTLSSLQFRDFLQKEANADYIGISAGDARSVLKSVGLSMEMLEAVSLLDVDLGESSCISPVDEFQALVKAGVDFLWSGVGKDPQGALSNEAVTYELLRDLLNRDKSAPQEVKKLALGELFDYLAETRMFEEYRECLWGLSRKAREDLTRRDRPWFPGCGSFDKDGRPVVDMEKTNHLYSAEFEEAAILVRCVNMQINAVRSTKFRDYLRQDDLSLAAVSRHLDSVGAAMSRADMERLAREQDAAERRKLEAKLWIRKAFGEADALIKPVWEAVCGDDSCSPYRWRFVCAGARFYYDWARYHWYSLDRKDVVNAADMYKTIKELADRCLNDKDADVETKAHFMYMASMACRYMAEATSSKKWSDGNVKDVDHVVAAINYAKKAFDLVPENVSKSLGYRFARNLARIQTFAVRWWLKHGTPDMVGDVVYERGRKMRAWEKRQWGKDVIDAAYEKIKMTLLRPMSPDERRDVAKGPLCLRGKRLLELEFHLRVQIEVIVAWVQQGAEAARPDVLQMRCALARVLLNYWYLCRGVTHLSHESLVWACDVIDRFGLARTDVYFGPSSSLENAKQDCPPSATCRFEIVNSILWSFGGSRLTSTAFFKIFKNNNSPERLALSELERDLDDDLRPMFKKENEAFCKKYPFEVVREDRQWVADEKWKDLPAFRHLNELIWSPGSNPRECERMFSHYGLDWNYYGKGACHG